MTILIMIMFIISEFDIFCSIEYNIYYISGFFNNLAILGFWITCIVFYKLQAVDLFMSSKDAFDDILQPGLPKVGSQ